MKNKRAYCRWHEEMETPAECSMKPTVKYHHTPTPWKIRNVEFMDTISIVAGNIPVAEVPKTIESLSTIGSNAEDFANAAFIVRAVNCHEELVEFVKYIRKKVVDDPV